MSEITDRLCDVEYSKSFSPWNREVKTTKKPIVTIEDQKDEYVFRNQKDRIKERIILEMKEHFSLYESVIPFGSSIVDIGTGTGFTAQYIKEKKFARIVGLDIEEHETYPRYIPHVLYDGEHIPFGNKKFDIGLLFYTLHHAENPGTVLDEAIRITKGKLIIIEESDLQEANHNEEMEKEASVYNALGLAPEFHHNGLTNQEFEELLSQRKDKISVESKRKLFSRTEKKVQKVLYIINIHDTSRSH
jgi:ubiquinone/menaquinone biosynthesis C-methylase UbiE